MSVPGRTQRYVFAGPRGFAWQEIHYPGQPARYVPTPVRSVLEAFGQLAALYPVDVVDWVPEDDWQWPEMHAAAEATL